MKNEKGKNMNDINKKLIILTTNRLIIRKIRMNDALFIYNLRSNDKNMKLVEIKPYENIQRAESFIKNVSEDIGNGNVFLWVIETKNSLTKVGTICLWSFSKENQSAEIGYELLPLYQKKGYAHEALQSILNFAETRLNLKAINAITHEKHEASIQLLLKNDFLHLGYVNELMPKAEDGPEMLLFRKIFSKSLLDE